MLQLNVMLGVGIESKAIIMITISNNNIINHDDS